MISGGTGCAGSDSYLTHATVLGLYSVAKQCPIDLKKHCLTAEYSCKTVARNW